MEAVETRRQSNAGRYAGLAGAWLFGLQSTNTRRAYRRDLQLLFSFFDSEGLDALSAERKHIDLWRSTLSGPPPTIARRLAAASSFYKYAEAEGYVQRQPVQNVKRPHVDPDFSATRGLSREEARALLDAARADNPRSHALISLLVLTGARISEALNARRSDLQHDAGHRVLVVTRKGGKRAKLPLPAPVIEAFAAYLSESSEHGTEAAVRDGASADAPLFVTSTGKDWAPSEAFRTVGRLASTAGIEGRVSPHSLRHTHATLALSAGVPLADLQDSMGPADPRTTRRYDRSRHRLERGSAYSVAAALA